MGYDNNNGGCCGGWGLPFGGFMNGFGGLGFDALLLFLFFGLMGGGMWGGMGGWGMGGMGWGGGAGMLGATSLAATETSALINQQNTADRVAAIGADVRQILGQTGGIIEGLNTLGNRTQDGFANVRTDMCQMGHNQAMQAVNNYNGLTGQITDLRFGVQQSFCDLRHQMQADKCETLGAIAASKSEILGAMAAQRMAELEAKNAKLENEISQNKQNATLIAAYQASQRGCNSCSPCCQPSPCDQLSAAIIAKGIDGIVNPVTPTTAAAA